LYQLAGNSKSSSAIIGINDFQSWMEYIIKFYNALVFLLGTCGQLLEKLKLLWFIDIQIFRRRRILN